MPKVAEIYINRPTNKLHKKLIYLIPDDAGNVAVGSRVYVPINRGYDEGIIVGYIDEKLIQVVEENNQYFVLNYDNKERIAMKFIIKVLDKDPWFTQEMLETARKLSDYYVCPMGEALSLFTINKKVGKGYERPTEDFLSCSEVGYTYNFGAKKRQKELVEYILAKGEQSISSIKKAGFSQDLIRKIKMLPFITVETRYKDTKTSYETKDISGKLPLTREQMDVCMSIKQSMDPFTFATYLLHGVTGSGKTQVYIKAVQDCLQHGKSAIVLVPEIGLTYQIVKRFVHIFGDEVVVFHSQLTVEERYNSWERLRRGESHIIIGARSAVFAPMENIGLVILDEEQDNSYKDWDNSHYHARKIAEIRCKLHHCPLLLGSATPSIESYYKAMQGKYRLLELPERIYKQAMPKVQIIDMKEELFFGNRSVFSEALYSLIQSTLIHNEQMILLLNRRGHSTFILCRECGKSILCPHCDTSLIYHKASQNLRCHYCEYTAPVPTQCPSCGSHRIKFFGSGTQKVEEVLKNKFPMARIARLDLDVKAKKGESERILEGFSNHEYDILLGTQIVSKGHDFKDVTAVGVLTADSILNIPNYTAAEQAFSLLTQTAGRAGRGKKEGKVVIQTYNPSHYAIIYSKDHNYKSFYETELTYREPFAYPPFGDMMHIMLQNKSIYENKRVGERIVSELMQNFPYNTYNIEILGPYEEMISKVRDLHRLSIMIRGKNLSEIKKYIMKSWIFEIQGIKINVDPI